jgi:hypothetical protein
MAVRLLQRCSDRQQDGMKRAARFCIPLKRVSIVLTFRHPKCDGLKARYRRRISFLVNFHILVAAETAKLLKNISPIASQLGSEDDSVMLQ